MIHAVLRSLVACLALALAPAAAQAEWQAVEKVQTYAVTGKTGAELYASIGARGPKLGGDTRAIAHTSFKLTWQRNYVPQGDVCTLVSARPKLTLVYTLPKPTGTLKSGAAEIWDIFISGVREHERVHGQFIVEMVRAIETASIGLSVAGDPGCSRIRSELTRRLGELSDAQRRRSRDFDRVELSQGGTIHQLILRLVNGR